MGGIIVYNTATALSMGKLVAGLRYSNMQSKKKNATAVIWETQVDKAFC